MRYNSKFLLKFILILSISISGSNTFAATNNSDPLEPLNRKIFNFNKFMDKVLLRPVTKIYTRATPKAVKRGVTNVLSNLNEPRNVINNALQGRFDDAVSDTLRFTFNTTFGLAGVFDVASKVGLEKHYNIYFTQTLAKWGWKKSMYFVVPFRGPSTVRGMVGILVDNYSHPLAYYDTKYVKDNRRLKKTLFKVASPKVWRNAQMALDTIRARATAMEFEDTMKNSSITFDEYEYVRNIYMQNHGDYTDDIYEQDLDEFYEED